MPRVSIVTMLYNEGKLFPRAVSSVFAQTFQDFEWIIVDDGSTDDTWQQMENLSQLDSRVKIIQVAHTANNSRTINRALREAKGEYIAHLGGDDYWEPTKLAKQVLHLDTHPNTGLVTCYPRFIGETNELDPFSSGDPAWQNHPYDCDLYRKPHNRSKDQWFRQLIEGNIIFGATIMYRREIHEFAGFFDERLIVLGDIDFYRKVVRKWDIFVIEEQLAVICIRPGLVPPGPEGTAKVAKEWALLTEKWTPVLNSKWPYEGKVFIATCFYDIKGFTPYINSLVRTVAVFEKLGVQYDFCDISSDSYIDRAQNTLAARFLDDESCTDLMLIESDHSWDPISILHLLNYEEEVVGAAYPTKNDWLRFCSIPKDDGTGHAITKRTKFGRTLIKADSVPTGFLRIKRSALRRFQAYYPELEYLDATADPYKADRKFTEFFGSFRKGQRIYRNDMHFCIRWQEMGGELWIDPDVFIGHYGSKGWHGNYLEHLTNQQLPTKPEAKAVKLSTQGPDIELDWSQACVGEVPKVEQKDALLGE